MARVGSGRAEACVSLARFYEHMSLSGPSGAHSKYFNLKSADIVNPAGPSGGRTLDF